jgi:tRNA (guanine37-N1)-methyltransferase
VAALTIIEAVTRLIPGVMGNDKSAEDESFASGMLEYPQYTRPASFRDWDVPDVLQSGDHKRISDWRRAAALHRTLAKRPEMLGELSADDRKLLERFGFSAR